MTEPTDEIPGEMLDEAARRAGETEHELESDVLDMDSLEVSEVTGASHEEPAPASPSPAPTAAEERRAHPRRQTGLRVDCTGRTAVLLHHPVADAGLGGLRLCCTAPEEPGTAVELVLHRAAQAGALVVAGQVAWSRERAMGICFGALDRTQETALRQLLESAREP